ncbi:MAG: T9SS type A sorting domain-containing protein [Gammaproteobacteria bacterium]|nr:T9SS type A sorting domain-containing protein [Gammaproteobacteria bacterium]
MKNYWLLFLVSFFIYNDSWSQCTPVDCRPGVELPVFGGVCSENIPTGIVNMPYVEEESFIIGGECFNAQDIDSTQISAVVWIEDVYGFSFGGLPSGITISANQTNYHAAGTDVVGCVGVSGTPTTAGLFQATLDFLVQVRAFIFGCGVEFLSILPDPLAFNFALDLIILPDPSFTGLSASYCANDASAGLTPTGTTGGTFSGPGVSGTTFAPATAGAGTHQIIYSVSAQQGLAVAPATNADTQYVTVFPVYDITINSTTCDPGQVGTVVQNLTASNGCDSTVTTIKVLDNTPPIALCRDLTIQLDAGSGATITAPGVDDGSNDACGVSLAIDISSFGCSELGANTVTLTVTDGAGNSNTCTSQITVEDPLNACNPCPDVQAIPITAGWNIISSHIQPDAPDMLDVLQNMSADIIILKNGAGDAVFPSIPLNGIGDWNVAEGYKVKASNTTTLNLGCTRVDPALTPISLSGGWSLVSYLRTDSLNAATALASLGANLIVAKDNFGNTYFPSIPLNGIGDLAPGQGYQVKLSAPATLTYPANTARLSDGVYSTILPPEHYNLNKNTGSNATIVIPTGSIPGLEIGDEIGIFNTNGQLAGSGVYNDQPLAIAVWGNDATSSDDSNFNDGESFSLRIWKPGNGREYILRSEFSSGTSHYMTNGLSVLGKTFLPGEGIQGQSISLDVETLAIYPNPVSDILTIHIHLKAATEVFVSIVDVTGRKGLSSNNHELEKGQHVLKLDISSLAAGQYFYILKTIQSSYVKGFVKMD